MRFPFGGWPVPLKLACVAIVVFGIGFVAGFVTHPKIVRTVAKYQWNRQQQRFMGKPAPWFEGSTVTGERWRLAEKRGSVVVIDFGAAWCAPCVGAYPVLRSLRERYESRHDFSIVGISLDPDGESLARHLKQHKIDWPVIQEAGKTFDNSVAIRYGINAIPSLWVVDQKGNVVLMSGSLEEVDEIVSRLLR